MCSRRKAGRPCVAHGSAGELTSLIKAVPRGGGPASGGRGGHDARGEEEDGGGVCGRGCPGEGGPCYRGWGRAGEDCRCRVSKKSPHTLSLPAVHTPSNDAELVA